ncbi:MAG TPA: hypothetical protein VFV87_12280, partial [Pirellulaceae bacterium]|nr:hypothetical protein [Pirellulaceae bacterium]
GTLLTGPGSWAYDVMAAQQMRGAILQRQYAIAAQKAQEDAAQKAARLATHTQRRISEQYRCQRFREFLAAAAQ